MSDITPVDIESPKEENFPKVMSNSELFVLTDILIFTTQACIVVAIYLFFFSNLLFRESPSFNNDILKILGYCLAVLIMFPLLFSLLIGENDFTPRLFWKRHQYSILFTTSKFSASDGSKLSLSHLSNLLLREENIILKNPNSPAPRFAPSWNSIPSIFPEKVTNSVIFCKKSKFRWIFRRVPTQFSIISQSEDYTTPHPPFHFYTRSSSMWELFHSKLMAYNYSPHILKQEKTQIPFRIRWQDNVLPLSIVAILGIILYSTLSSLEFLILGLFTLVFLVFFIVSLRPPVKWYVPTSKLGLPIILIFIYLFLR